MAHRATTGNSSNPDNREAHARGIGVLFVCTGNICRSPTAEGIFAGMAHAAGLAGQVRIDSAGTSGYHVGEPPDSRAQEAARARGVEIGSQRARRVIPEDFARFDLILAMDRSHLTALQRMAPAGTEERLRLFLDFAPHLAEDDVPDPYYGGVSGFDRVFDMIEAAAAGLLDHVRATLAAKP
jgi:protein-tyrosine phosphatase